MLPRRTQIMDFVARLISPSSDIEVSLTDFLLPATEDIDSLSTARIRGETARLCLEAFADALASDSRSPNLAYFLAGFPMENLSRAQIHVPSGDDYSDTWLHGVFNLVEQLATARDDRDSRKAANRGEPIAPEWAQHLFAGLYEPALRVLLRMCSFQAACSAITLRFMRSQHDLVLRLLKSRMFRQIENWPSHSAIDALFFDSCQQQQLDTLNISAVELALGDCVDNVAASLIVQKSLQAIVLELTALELSALLRLRQRAAPRHLVTALLSPYDAAFDDDQTPHQQQQGQHQAMDDDGAEGSKEQSSLFMPRAISTPVHGAEPRVRSRNYGRGADVTAASFQSSVTRMEEATLTEEHQKTQKLDLLWTLLGQSRVHVEEFFAPQCTRFDAAKLDELLSLCLRRPSSQAGGSERLFDVGYLLLLFNSELAGISHPDIAGIRQEAHSVLQYCVRRNARSMLESACIHLLNGWLCAINVLAIQAPLPFIEPEVHQSVLVDALFLLHEYCQRVQMSSTLASSVSACVLRLVHAMCTLLPLLLRSNNEFLQRTISNKDISKGWHGVFREALFPVLHLLIECLVIPGYSKCVAFKRDIYSALLFLFDTCNSQLEELDQDQSKEEQKSQLQQKLTGKRSSTSGTQIDDDEVACYLLGATEGPGATHSSVAAFRQALIKEIRRRGTAGGDHWSAVFNNLSHEIVETTAADITFAPMELKAVATAVLSDIVREDVIGSQAITRELLTSGQMRCLLETLGSLVHGKQDGDNNDPISKQRRLLLVKALLSLVIRLAGSTDVEQYYPGLLTAAHEWFRLYQVGGSEDKYRLPLLLPQQSGPALSAPVRTALGRQCS